MILLKIVYDLSFDLFHDIDDTLMSKLCAKFKRKIDEFVTLNNSVNDID